MVQLSQPVETQGLSLQAAQAALRAAAEPLRGGSQTLPIGALRGRVLSEAVQARCDVPPFANSAVDGYAFAAGPGAWRQVTGTLAAGDPVPQVPLAPGTAMRVLTGAPLPPGADTVMMDEDAVRDGDQLALDARLKPGSNARPQGEDVRAQQRLYPAGHMIRALDMARMAAGGLPEAPVHRPLKIHVVSSGDELIKGQISDANRWMIQAVFHEPAFDLSFGAPLPDALDASVAALRQIQADLVLTSGGVSVGERDFLRQAIEHIGQIDFWRVGIKPGRPVAFGALGDGTPIFGLPGNPVACLVTALFLARPYALARLGAHETWPLVQAPLARDIRKNPRRTEFVRVQLDDEGRAHAYPVAGAGIISSLTAADALAVLGEEGTLFAAGSRVPILPLRGLLP